ncbi:hypothetical protein MFIFM68171_10143 [Madurella fahalii]|uniref:Uncharacterized protein n=1 Tax=Madurella fahalii TaxID=1157608 RepID=A0ABQ0GQB0_9PEZI
MLKLYTRTTILVDLHFTIYWESGRCGQQFPPAAFAVDVITESPDLFLQSLDLSCLDRIRAATKYTIYSFGKPVNYEAERSLIWKGLEDSRLSMRGLNATEFDNQLKLMRKRGYQDHIRVEMAVEIEAGDELRNRA